MSSELRCLEKALALALGEGLWPLWPEPVLPAVPGAMRLRVDAIDHDVDVFLGCVAMGHDKGLMAFQAEVPQGGIYDVVPLLAGEVLAWSQRDGKVLDRILSAALGVGGAHNGGRVPWLL
jgi:hypothetical protein